MIDPLELAVLADRVLQIAGDDVEQLAEVLDRLDPDSRAALLDSDLLNAYQVFYYHFRELPGSLAEDRLLLHAAQETRQGILLDGEGDLDLVFVTREGVPVMEIREADTVVTRFEGKDAYRRAQAFLAGPGR
jgi:hypothetical protein